MNNYVRCVCPQVKSLAIAPSLPLCDTPLPSISHLSVYTMDRLNNDYIIETGHWSTTLCRQVRGDCSAEMSSLHLQSLLVLID